MQSLDTYYKLRKKSDPAQYAMGSPASLSYGKRGRVFQTEGQLRAFITALVKAKRDISDLEVATFQVEMLEPKELHTVMSKKTLLRILTNE